MSSISPSMLKPGLSKAIDAFGSARQVAAFPDLWIAATRTLDSVRAETEVEPSVAFDGRKSTFAKREHTTYPVWDRGILPIGREEPK